MKTLWYISASFICLLTALGFDKTMIAILMERDGFGLVILQAWKKSSLVSCLFLAVLTFLCADAASLSLRRRKICLSLFEDFITFSYISIVSCVKSEEIIVCGVM